MDVEARLDVRLTSATLETYFAAGIVVPLRVLDAPICTLRIDPPGERLELWTPMAGPAPDVGSMRRVTVTTEELDDGSWFVLGVDAAGARLEAYCLLAAVVDDLSAGRRFHEATTRSLDTFRDLLTARGRMSEEKAIGLVGELLLLEHLIGALDEVTAVGAWLGPRSEEHDFVLASVDAEVKTTLSERRQHIIGTESQLDPSPERPLWLISVQLTRSGGARQGFGLPDVIGRVRAAVGATRGAIDGHLGTVGWRDADIDVYRDRYMFRSASAAYRVDDTFPAVTRSRLDAVVPQAELVGRVTYRVDVSGLDRGIPPHPLADFVEGDNP